MDILRAMLVVTHYIEHVFIHTIVAKAEHKVCQKFSKVSALAQLRERKSREEDFSECLPALLHAVLRAFALARALNTSMPGRTCVPTGQLAGQ